MIRLSPGSYCVGTLRQADLLDNFATLLALHQHGGNEGVIIDAMILSKKLNQPWCSTCRGTGEVDEALGGEGTNGIVVCPDCDTQSELYDADMLIDALVKRLEDLVPPGFYFGAHPSDGADFGVWMQEDEYANV